jgi:cell division protein FtsN
MTMMARAAVAGLLWLAPPVAAQQAKRPAPVPAPAPPAAPPSVQAGVDLWRAGDYPAAVAIWQPFAAAGDADAMFNMGQAYKLGRAVAVDKVQARDWYRKAALKNHLPAQANLGILLFQAGDKTEAARWLKQAADRGEMRAQYVLGVAHWNGDGVPRSMAMAYAYLTRASAQGLTEATGALTNLSRTLSATDRASGATIAASLAAGTGVPAGIPTASPTGRGVTAAELNRRGLETVQKPAPRPVETALAPLTPATPPPPTPTPVSPSVPPTLRPASPAVRTTDVPASDLPTGATRPVETAGIADQPAEKPVVKPGDADKAKAADEAKLAEKAKASDKTKVADAAKTTEKAKATDKAKAAEAPAPGWRVQLGAFGSRAQAETAWGEIRKKQKTAVGKSKPIYDPGRSIVKLQIGPYKTRAEAKDACAKLAFAGQACFVTEG